MRSAKGRQGKPTRPLRAFVRFQWHRRWMWGRSEFRDGYAMHFGFVSADPNWRLQQ